MRDPDRPITLAAIAGAHGVRGEVRLKLLCDGLEELRPHRLFNGDALELEAIRADGKGGALARFAGVSDREAAERLRGTALTVPRGALPALEEGEYYHADLIGLPARTCDGEAIGTIAAVHNYGATDLVEIEREGGKPLLVPITADAVVEWNADRMIVARAFAED